MDDNIELIIRDVHDKIAHKNRTESPSTWTNGALIGLCGGYWNVVMYSDYDVLVGLSSSSLHWRNKWWAYTEKTTSIDFAADEIKKFMVTEFGWATIKDSDAAQKSAYIKINNKFLGSWRAHVARIKSKWSWSMRGTAWTADGLTLFFFIYRLG
ncbi:unnamed protein product [Rotaria magnacalcarata]|uniref:Uncharacterized protein n=2 Tax=Rotaria magnacalcarata TaxID=392030 RepID=A0A816WI22_9BILA|nr:unnamed protein product [Rotaria magnacalcarata]